MDLVAKLEGKPYYEMSVEEARASNKLVFTDKTIAGDVQYDGSRKELFIPQPDFTGRLRIACDRRSESFAT